MMQERGPITQLKESETQEFAIDKLLADFHASVEAAAESSQLQEQMHTALKEHNPRYVPVNVETWLACARVLAEVTAGVYAPLIHGFTSTLVKNIGKGRLPNNVIAPPRDAIPLAISIQAQAEVQGVDIQVYQPAVNRIVAGVANNQCGDAQLGKDPHFDLMLDQLAASINGSGGGILEVEPGIYGTLSPKISEAFRERGCRRYVAVKLYGLGPNISYVHGVLSGGKEFVAEKAEESGLVDKAQIEGLMTMTDSLEEFGMQNATKSVEELYIRECGTVAAIVISNSEEAVEIARVTNRVIVDTAHLYADISPTEVKAMLDNFPRLVNYSNQGLPLSLMEPIPSMDSKEEHFERLRSSGLLDYPQVILHRK